MKVVRGGERQAYKPGELVPISGIYTAVHERHRPRHDVVALKGEEFPLCRICKVDVRFYITRLIPHMTHDFDLTGPDSGVLEEQAKAAKRGAG